MVQHPAVGDPAAEHPAAEGSIGAREHQPRPAAPGGSTPDDRLRAVADEVAECRRCERLVAWREEVSANPRASYRDEIYWGRGVPGFGDPAARLVVLGLAPAAHGANRTGRMFTGDRSGDWLYRALWRCGFANQPTSVSADDGLALTDCWVTSPVKCAPPGNHPTAEEREACSAFLNREIAALDRARVFVALGGFAHREACRLLGLRPRPAFAHGACHVAVDGRVLLDSYHVSQQNTFTGRLTVQMLDSVFEDAARLLRTFPASATEPTSGPELGRTVAGG